MLVYGSRSTPAEQSLPCTQECRLGPVAAQHLAAALTLLRKQDDNPLDPRDMQDSIWDNCGDVSQHPTLTPAL